VLDLKPKVVSEPERKNQARFPVQGARRSPLAVMDLFSTQYNCTDDVIIRIAISLYYSLLIQASVSPKTQVLVQTRRYLQSQSGTLLDCHRYTRDCSKWGDITTVREAPAVGTREVARVTGARPCVTGPVVDALTRSSSVTVPTRHHINHHGVGTRWYPLRRKETHAVAVPICRPQQHCSNCYYVCSHKYNFRFTIKICKC
jgi:hypothetical protein